MKKTLNVLSIDMDFILAPCINLYNDFVSASNNPDNIWEKLNRLRNIDEHISYSEENLQYVFNIFTLALSRLKNKNNVSFAINHDAILFDLASEKYINNQFNIYNIDHHHDIYYSETAKKEVDDYDVANVANWIWYLDKYSKISQYNWICNKNSFFPEDEVKSIGKMDAYTKENFKQIFDVEEWDYIFVCHSPHWFPRKYDFFLDMLIDIYKNISNNKDVAIVSDIFSPNGLSQKYPYDAKNRGGC